MTKQDKELELEKIAKISNEAQLALSSSTELVAKLQKDVAWLTGALAERTLELYRLRQKRQISRFFTRG